MRYFVLIILSICFFSAAAQSPVKKDTVYYLFDSAHTTTDKWDISIDGPVTYYTIKCSCLPYGQNPIFIRKPQIQEQIISNQLFKKINTISLTSLIDLSKKDMNTGNEPAGVYVFIEKKQKDYVMYRVYLEESHVSIDYEIIKPSVDSTKK